MWAWRGQNLRLVYKEPMMHGDVVDRKRLEDLCPECGPLSGVLCRLPLITAGMCLSEEKKLQGQKQAGCAMLAVPACACGQPAGVVMLNPS